MNTANRQSKAEQLKLDELIRAVDKANNSFMKLEQGTITEIEKMEQKQEKNNGSM